MRIATLATIPNLRLAWRRITTGANPQYKRYYRHLYSAYELALDDNLRDLRERLVARTWRPHPAERVYLPKVSGLQRPLTLLYIEDQIVLQAIANLLSQRVAVARAPFLLKTVFSNVVQSRRSIFFVRSWRRTYQAFTAQVDKHYASGRRWVADFDLAAFYETISHDLLIRTAFPRLQDSDDVKWVKQCLSVWTSDQFSTSRAHGLPQGPIASDLLAEIILLPVDRAMQKHQGYVRYVDDVRLFARSEVEIRKVVRALEIACRDRGLIPQVGKFAVKRAQSMSEARGMLPSVGSSKDSSTPRLSATKAEQLIKRAIGGRPLRVVDKSRLRYVMYRAEPSNRLVGLACRLMPRHPEHVDAFAEFLRRAGYRERIRACCLDVLDKTPYPYVASEMWRVLADYVHRPIAIGPQLLRSLTVRATATVRARDADVALKTAAAAFLSASDRRTGKNSTKVFRRQSALLQGFVGPLLPDVALTNDGVIREFLASKDCEPGLGIAGAVQSARITLAAVGVRATALNSQLRNTFRVLGIVRSVARHVDVIAEMLDARYGTLSEGRWKNFLSGEYSHAMGLLVQAEAAFRASPSYWLSHQNSFNQAVFLALQGRLRSLAAPGVVTTRGSNGQLVGYGTTLDVNNAFSKAHPAIARAFRVMNERRNKLPGSHPYDKKSAAQTKYLKAPERNALVGQLRVAFADLMFLLPK